MLYLVADAHIVRRVWKHRTILEGDAYRAWDRMVDMIIADKAENKTLLLAGDILDFRMIDGWTLEVLDAGIEKLFDAGVGVIFTQGNHDLNPRPHLKVLGGSHAHKTIKKTLDGRTVYGLDYMPRDLLHEELAKVPDCDILMMHAAGEHLLGFEGAFEYQLEQLPTNVKYVLVGDIHVTDITETTAGVKVISPGSLHPLSIAEGGAHGFYKMYENGELEFVQVPGREIHRFNVKTDKDVEKADKVLKELPELIQEDRPIVELCYDPNFTAWAVGTSRALSDMAVFFMDEKLTMPDNIVLDGDRPVYEQMTLKNALSMVLKPEEDPELFGFTENLLGSKDPDNYVEEWLGDIG